ncbi:hypothetical protein PMAYCL1PPCAC_29767 [Pristionchus mayeri]|uniref:Beta-Casp domain-containing protein n=1 Tax=Pristionchus mayeri TaxID=1317129 RepID=A0AAN5DCC4_9BILA|nr:hypothetical protein PMAYCL1PPCAC_29767 [Pristionchus mayeri]
MSKTSTPNLMQVTCMAWTPNRPCMVMRFPNTTIMLDCALDMSSLSHFTPFMYSVSERLKRCDSYPSSSLHYIKQICGKHYVEAMPEMHPVPMCSMSMEEVDAILISNWNSLLALPFYTEGTGFSGRVYASEPTLQYGTLMMEELMEYFQRITHDKSDNVWKDPEVYADFLNAPMRSPLEWQQMYSEETMKKALERVRVVAFTQPVTIDGNIKATSHCSGYAIGSCNWIVSRDAERFGYISASSNRSLHTRAVDWKPFKDLDTMVVTSLCTLRDNSPEKSAMALVSAVAETVKQQGSVILPINPCGLMFDLLDLLAKTLDAAMDIPIYVISPVAKRALAFANVYPEWLSDGHQERVYMPEEPFRHHRMMETKKIKVYDSIYGEFSRELKTPCVIITGHPSLRVGDAAHLIEMWGNDPRNAVIISDAEYPPQDVYGPFEDLKIRCLYYPVDCRVDFWQLNHNILPELKPTVLVVPDAYTRGHSDIPNTCVEYNPVTPLRHEETARIPSKSRKRKMRIHPEIAAQLRPRGFSAHPERGLCSLKGVLNCYDNQLKLEPAPQWASTATRPVYTGKLSVEALTKSISKAGFSVNVSKENGKTLFSIDKLNAVISLSADGLHTNIRAPREHRLKLSEAISASLLAI